MKVEVTCDCGKKFFVQQRLIERGLGKSCSRKCASKKSNKFPYKGVMMTIKEIIKLPECNFPYSTMYFRIVKRMMTVEDAMAVPAKKEVRRFLWKGKEMSLYQIARDKSAKVAHATIQTRVGRGWSLEEAVLTPSGLQPEVKIVKSKKSKPRKEIAEIFKVPVNPNKCRYTAGGWK